jgi:hypothetical protein
MPYKLTFQVVIITGVGPKCRTLGSRNFILRQDWEAWLESLPTTNLVDIPPEVRAYQRKLERREEAACVAEEVSHG